MKIEKEKGISYNPENKKTKGQILLKERKEIDIDYIKDGEQVINHWDFLNGMGLIEDLKKQGKFNFPPLHDLEILKKYRIEYFEFKKLQTIKDYKLSKQEFNEIDNTIFYIAMLNAEIEEFNKLFEKNKIEKKLSINHQKNILLYIQFVKDEIEKTKSLLNEPKQQTKSKQAYTTFESMFVETSKAEKIIDKLIDYETLSPQGELVKHFYEIVAITEALQVLGIIKKEIKQTNRNTLFGNKIKATISDKTSRTKSKNHYKLVTEYKELFISLI